jgi:hypothetical protein
MPESKRTFLLKSKGTTLGRVEPVDGDFPWYFGRFHPSDAFSTYAPVFAEAERAREARDSEQLNKVVEQIVAMELQLVCEKSGELAGEPDIMWIHEGRVSWRGSSGALRKYFNPPT